MKMVPKVVLVVLGILGCNARHQAPAGKAVELLEELWQQGQAELNDEAVRYEKLKQWCTDTATSKESEIQEGQDKEERASAVVERTEAAAAAAQQDIEELLATVAKLDEEMSRAGGRRRDESSAYVSSDQELQKSIRAVRRATFSLREKSDADGKAAAASELQMARTEALAALQVEEPGLAASSIQEMLTKLSDRFHEELEDLRKAETKAKQEHDLMLNQLKLEKEQVEAALRSKRAVLGEARGAHKEAKEDLEDVRTDLQQDQKYAQDLQVMCSLKADTFKKRRRSRQAELQALKTAVALLKDKVSGLAQLRLFSSGSALAALRSGEVRRAFQALRSAGLEVLATRLAGEPLAKVRQMISETIRRLEEASRGEAEKQSFCTAELAASHAAKTAAKDAAEEVLGELEEAKSEVDQLAEDQATLRKELAELGRVTDEAQKERAQAKAKNAASMKEAEESQKALEAALVMLREVYGQVPASLLQVEQAALAAPVLEGAPETFPDVDYVATPQKGVLELLEVAASSYASAAAELADEEQAEEGQFQHFLVESRKDQAIKSRELVHSEDRLERKQMALKQGKAELAKSTEKLEKVQAYLEKLQDQCKAPVVTPEERRQKREQELTALKQALSALEESPAGA